MAENNEDSKIPSDLTKIDRFDIKFRWTIADFLEFPGKNGDIVESRDFCFRTAFVGVKWRINGLLYPLGDSKQHEDWLGVFLAIKVTPPNASLGFTFHNQISLIGSDGLKKVTQKVTRSKENWDLGRGHSNFVKLKDLENLAADYLPNGDLTLEFEGTAYIRFDPAICKLAKPKRSLQPVLTFDILKNLWENGTYSDVVIKAGGRRFNCHKVILSVRSEYFRAMFESGMEESREGAVDFSHQMNGEELKVLLEYLYLGKSGNLNATCQTMLKVAEMFGLQELKSLSEEALIKQLNPDNAWDFVNLAREHGAKSLQKEAHLLIAKSLN